MQADSGRKYRLYPTADQAEVLTRWGHTCRALWNVALEQREFMWAQRRPGPGQAPRDGGGRHQGDRLRAVEQCAHLTRARAELDWMADLHKLTSDLAKNHGWVGIENLNVKGMTASA